MTKKYDVTKKKWLLCLLLPFLCFFIPLSEAITPNLKTFIIITIFCITLAATEVIPLFITGILFMALYSFSGIVSTGQAFAAFGTEVVWIAISALLLVHVVERTTILKRMAYWAVLQSRGSYLGLLICLCILAIVLKILLQATLAIVCVASIAASVVDALKLRGTKAGAAMILVPAFTYISPFFLYMPESMLLFYTQIAGMIDISTDYIKYFHHNAVFIFLPFTCTFVIYLFTKPKESINLLAIKEMQAALPKMKSLEKKIVVLLILFVTYLFTTPLHGMNIFYGFIFLPILFFMPGINAGTVQDIQKINFSMVIFIGACLAIGMVGGMVGIGKAVTLLAVPLLDGLSESIFLACVYSIGFILNFIMTPIAEIAALTVPITQICLDLGFNIDLAYYTLLMATCQAILPYEIVPLLISMTIGGVSTGNFIRIMSIVAIITTIFIFTAGFAYWSMVGLL